MSILAKPVSIQLLLELCNELEMICKTELRDHPQLSKTADKVATLVRDWRLLLSDHPEKGNWRDCYQ